MGRRYIGIEQMDYINEITVPRLQKVIEGEQEVSQKTSTGRGGSFVYVELVELNAYFIHEIQKAQSTEELEKLFAVMKTGHISTIRWLWKMCCPLSTKWMGSSIR